MNIIIKKYQGEGTSFQLLLQFKHDVEKVFLSCMLLLVQLGDGQEPTNRPSNGK